MDIYILLLLLFGISSFGMAFMPAVTQRTGISYSLFYVAAGALIYSLWPDKLPSPLPADSPSLTLHLAEIIVIISLMGTAIKIDRTFSFKNWSSPLKLVSFAMIFCMLACGLMGYYFLGLALPSAVLIAAVLAPTDPVLAADVQVGPPEEKSKSESKFALTSEAGLNDGMAFPFTWLAVLLALAAAGEELNLWYWAGYHLIYKIAAGVAIGWLIGKASAYLIFTFSEKYNLIKSRDGFLAISLTLCAYGVAEAAHAYGFIAVFVAGYTLRHAEKGHDYHQELHSFTDQIERILLGILLLFLGGSLVQGILEPLTWKMVLFAVAFLLIIRPVVGWLSLTGSNMLKKERLVISFFGIRGMGTVFYLSFALEHASFTHKDELWAIAALTILLSIVLHGLTATTVMDKLEKEVPDQPIPK